MDASYVDLADPQRLEFDYLRRMRDVVEVAGARRVLHVGGGACALPRALAAAHPDHRQEVVEVDPAVVELARRHLGLRRAPGLRVRVGEGREVLARRGPGSADAVVVDAFVGARVPRRLVSAAALAACARVVAPAGVVAVNVVDSPPLDEAAAIAAGLAAALPHVFALGPPARWPAAAAATSCWWARIGRCRWTGCARGPPPTRRPRRCSSRSGCPASSAARCRSATPPDPQLDRGRGGEEHGEPRAREARRTAPLPQHDGGPRGAAVELGGDVRGDLARDPAELRTPGTSTAIAFGSCGLPGSRRSASGRPGAAASCSSASAWWAAAPATPATRAPRAVRTGASRPRKRPLAGSTSW